MAKSKYKEESHMTNGKSDRKKLVKGLVTIIVVIIAAVLGINITDLVPNEENGQETVVQDSTQIEHGVEEIEGELILTMIDVGQADSFVLVQGGKVALIDCGTRSTGEDVVQYLKSIGITKIDYVFGTHPHDDHMGGMYDVITNFEIGKIIIPEVKAGTVTTNWYLKLMQEIKTGGYELEYAKLGTEYNLGNASMEIIGLLSDPKDNMNNYSPILKVTFGEMDIIMTGDAETEVEAEVLKSDANLEAEILKMGHHGSDTSSSDAFLDAINPDYALISAKVGNKYEHPKKVTMDKLKKRNIQVYRTDENGTVVLTVTTKDVSFSCNPGDYLSGIELEEREAK